MDRETGGKSQADSFDERESVRRALEERSREEKRQASGSTPTEDVMERALDLAAEPDVEWHAGEDAGEVPELDE